MLQFSCELLNLIEPANQILEKREIGFSHAIGVIEATSINLKHLRTDENF